MTDFSHPQPFTVLLTKGRSACSCFPHKPLFAPLSQSRHFSAGLFPLLAISLTSAALAPVAAQTVSVRQIDRLIAAHAVKFAPGLDAQLAEAAHRNDPQTGHPALIPVIIQTDGTAPALARPLLSHTSFAAFKAGYAQIPALIALNRYGTLAARLSPAAIARLAADPHTAHISPDLEMRSYQNATGPLYYDYAPQAVGADFALLKNNLSGKGVNVAVIDTGVYPHNDLTTPTQRIVGWVDMVNGQTTPYDDNGHGTHVAGLVAGNGADSKTFGYNAWMVRTAPSANIIGVKVLDKNGAGSVSGVIAGIDWCVAHKKTLNIRVLNLSAGHPIGESYTTDPLCQACERANAVGITVVCAAGNYGRSVPSDPNSATQWGSITSPGNDPRVITVGAMNTMGTQARADDKICTYSSRGPTAIDLGMKPDLVAPGNDIISLAAPGSTLYAQAQSCLLNPLDYNGTGLKTYITLSGTSMAAPIVAGAAALLLQADPTLSPDTIKARLMLSAGKVANMDYLSYGAGYVNVVGALQLTQVAATGTFSPSVVRAADGSVSVQNFGWGGGIIKGQNFGWGGDIIKSSNFGWGGDIIKASNFGWGGTLPPTKNLSDYSTAQNFGWSDTVFVGSGVFGGKVMLPQNFGTGPNPLWTGGVAPLSTPNQTDAMHLLFDGD